MHYSWQIKKGKIISVFMHIRGLLGMTESDTISDNMTGDNIPYIPLDTIDNS